ncbi:MAG: hypothetical protein JWN77_1713 [Frankiales bacterium]|jgi:hypothetical protein|nr:hypothetical protein [Frankiales bacterium]
MSLVTTPASKLGTCGTCVSTRITEITMTLTDGSIVDFVSCHSCETKSWKQGGVDLDITSVLGKAKKHKVAA